MTKEICPKCHGIMTGPSYNKSFFGIESLRYNCGQCGYSHQKPCKDAITTFGGLPKFDDIPMPRLKPPRKGRY